MRAFILSLFCILFCCAATGQEETIWLDRLTLEDGLKQATIHDMIQDSEGMIWMATYAGLCRYDGYEFHYFPSSDPPDSLTLTSGQIFALKEASDRSVWIGTIKDINRYNPYTGTFQHLPFYDADGKLREVRTHCIFEDSKDQVWFGTTIGLGKWNPQKQIIQLLPAEKRMAITSIFEDKQHRFWLTTSQGLYCYENGSFQSLALQPPLEQTALSSHIVDHKGRHWIGSRAGLLQVDLESGAYTKKTFPAPLDRVHVRKILVDRLGFLWIGTSSDGVIRWNPDQNTIQHYNHSPYDLDGLVNKLIFSLIEDSFGNIWIGTDNGVNKINPAEQDLRIFKNRPGYDNIENYVMAICEDLDGGYWVGSVGGLFYSEYLGGPSKQFLSSPTGKKRMHAHLNRTIELDPEGNIWIGSYSGMHFADRREKIPHHISIHPALDKARIYRIIQASDKTMWSVGTSGIFQIDPLRREVLYHLPSDTLATTLCREIIEEKPGIFWIGYQGGLARLDTKENTLDIFEDDPEDPKTLKGHTIRGLTKGGPDKLWIGSDDGVSILNTQTLTFRHLNNKSGLPQNGSAIIVKDLNGDIWTMSTHYINKIDPESLEVAVYDVFDTPNKEFNIGARYIDEEGNIYMGGINGFFVFHPDSIQPNSQAPKMILTDFQKLFEPVRFNQPVNKIKEIFLDYHENVITFKYAGLHYIAPKEIQYAYQLEGFDPHWLQVGNKREATYTNLDPGEYTFRVKAANPDGYWSEDLSVRLNVSPPYWQTTWFRAFIASVLIAIGFGFFSNLRRRRELQKQKEVAEQSAAYKSKFLANVSHEIRTPMNAIVGMGNLLAETPLNEKQDEYVGAIRQSAENLLVIINDILDFSKISSGKYTFRPTTFELSTLIRQLDRIFQFKVREKNLQFSINRAEGVPELLVGDMTRLNQILMNLISNAIKFTREGGVELAIRNGREKGGKTELIFEVRDTGVGIPRSQLETIFESFQQGKNELSDVAGGTGLGLSIARQLVEQQGGNISVVSKPDHGTTFRFNIWFDLPSKVQEKEVVASHSDTFDSEVSILLAEDAFFNQMLAKELIKKHIPKANLDIAENGQIAVEKLESHNYDLILMDIKMPVMDGYEATEIIRNHANPMIANIPIIAVTANAIPEQLERCREAGMNAFVTKPIKWEELMGRIQEVTSEEWRDEKYSPGD